MTKIYNIGNSSPESLLDFVETLENCLIEEGIIEKKGERELEKDFGFRPETGLKDGLSRYAKWYREFYGLGKATT